MFRAFVRTIKYAVQDLFRNFWLSLITITIMVLALLSVNFLVILNTVSSLAIETLEDKVDVSVYFNHDVNDNQIFEIESMVLALPQTQSAVLISKEEALEQFLERHADNTSIIDAVTELEENPLGVSLIIKAQTANDYEAILALLNEPKFADLIKETSYQEHEAVISSINDINSRVRRIGLVVSIIFALIALIVIYNTIRITIYTHRTEIKIMKLVGATNWFVKAPYLWQALIYSAVACLLALILVYPFIEWLQPFVQDALQASDLNLVNYYKQEFLKIYLIELGIASLFSIVSSNGAARRYLDV